MFDFSIGYQHRDRLGVFSYDVAASVMASSDFEGSSREGIRFPGHAVGFLSVGPRTELVFGVDYLDRGDCRGRDLHRQRGPSRARGPCRGRV